MNVTSFQIRLIINTLIAYNPQKLKTNHPKSRFWKVHVVIVY